jgi:DNA-binding NtrC family response regulator
VTERGVEQYEFLGLRAVVASPAMRAALERVSRVAKAPSTVLIQGESGSGKEIVARALHQMSPRSQKPWVDVSCGALPEHLMESELFGYERGAFSGADTAKPGLFELAHTGTLFLDEVGELEPRMQVKLLRVLDGAPYFRLGGVRKISVDVRVVAATNVDLERSSRDKRFREDLYHRLSQLVVHVPPLRERPEDIDALARHFLEQVMPGATFSDAALGCLRRHDWPGNVRELRNVVTRAAVEARGGEIAMEDLGLPEPAIDLLAEGDNLDGLERAAILRVLGQTRGHRQRAADLLGISRRTLSRKLKQYALDDMPEPIDAGRPNWGLRGDERNELPGKTA